MRLGSFTANIVVDGKALEEYDVNVERPTKVTCWVPSEEGKSFSVQWESHEETRPTSVKGSVTVDGIGCGFKIMGWLNAGEKGVFTRFIGATTYRELTFARVQLSDDDSLLNKKTPKDLGNISLEISRGRMIRKPRNFHCEDLAMLNDRTFHERTKKASVHCVGFGTETARQPSPTEAGLLPNDDPALVFVFEYRPLGVLQANGVAPRSIPKDTGAGDKAHPTLRNLTPDPAMEDIKPAELNDRIRGLENKLKYLRKLQGNIEDQKPKRVKREERSRPLFTPGETIDLT